MESTKTKQRVKKITVPVMTTYEKSKIITKRIHSLNNGANSTIDDDILETYNLYSSYDIAMYEFDTNKLPPYTVIRNFPNGEYELWTHDEFEIFPD